MSDNGSAWQTFASGETLAVKLLGEEAEVAAASLFADSQGRVNAPIVLPGGLPLPSLGAVEVSGLGSSGAGITLLSRLVDLGSSFGEDADADGVGDLCDNCPTSPGLGTSQLDSDLDGVGDLCDPCPLEAENDADGDGVCAPADPCPLDPDNDADGDGRCAPSDNCPFAANPSQQNVDALPAGDTCQCGDVTGEGRVDVLDRVLMARYAAGMSVPTSFKLQRCSTLAPDMSCDGADDAELRSYLVGATFPLENRCLGSGL